MKRIKYKILIGLLAIGTVAGFGSGFASVHSHRHHKEEMARHLSRVCVDAAMAAREGEADRLAVRESSCHHDRMARLEREVRHRCAAEGRRHGN
jgi:hypothetical protein